MGIAVGDQYTIGERTLTVQEIVHTTDADGLATGWDSGTDWYGQVAVTLERYVGQAEANATDELLCIYVLRDETDADYYSVGVWHPGYGRDFILAPEMLPITHTVTPYWIPGDVTIKESGVAVGEGTGVTVVEIWQTPEDGAVMRLHSANKRRTVGDYVFQTDASGVVKWYNARTATQEQMCFIKKRGSDTDWNGEVFPGYLQEIRVYYKQQYVALVEGEDATLDVIDRTGSLKVYGPSTKPYYHVALFYWAGSRAVAYGGLGGAGEWTFTDLVPGKYTFVIYHLINTSTIDKHYLPERKTTTGERSVFVQAGETAEITLPTPQYVAAATQLWCGYLYEDNQTPLAGQQLNIVSLTADDGSEVSSTITTDSDGYWEYDYSNDEWPPLSVVIDDPTWGTLTLPRDTTSGSACEAILGSYIFITPLDYTAQLAELEHVDLPEIQIDVYAKNIDTGDTYALELFDWDLPVGMVGWTTAVALPKFQYTNSPTGAGGYNTFKYQLYIEDALKWGGAGHSLHNVYLVYTVPYSDYEWARAGFTYSKQQILGSRIHGEINVEDTTSLVGAGSPELQRMGIEHGDVSYRLEQHYVGLTDGNGDPVNFGSTCGGECPDCQWELWPYPSNSVLGITYGYCPNHSPILDGRSYFRSFPLLSAANGITVRHIRIKPNRVRYAMACKHWYYPADYDPNTHYDMAEHLLLGTWAVGAFTDGVDNTAIDDNLEDFDTIGVDKAFRPKVVPIVIAHDATYALDVQYLDGITDTVEFALSAGQTDITILNTVPFTVAEQEIAKSEMLLIADVTDVRHTGGTDTDNSFQVVADVPAILWMHPPTGSAYPDTPYALPLWMIGWVDMYTDEGNIMWALYSDGSHLYTRYRQSPYATWSDPQEVVAGSYGQGGITGVGLELVVQGVANGSLYQWHSLDGGATWTDDGEIS